MNKILLILFLFISHIFLAQEYVFGKVVSEQNTEIKNVLVVNIRTDEKTYSDSKGNFMISARIGDYLRFVKQKFDRVNHKILPEDLKKSLMITLVTSAQEIKEVEITAKLTGNLREDINRVEPKRKVKLNREISKYILQKTDIALLKARAGEFVQPKGEGFSIGKVSNRRDMLDIQDEMLEILGEEYFIELGLKKSEISPFMNYVFKNLEFDSVYKNGYLKSGDILKFQQLAEEKIKDFKKVK